jgi:hypothetical protein
MKMAMSAAALLAMVGCVPLPPVQPRLAPEPTPQEITSTRATQTRVLAVGREAVFPRIVELLMDNGFSVRSANESLGIVSFYQQWVDGGQSGAIISQEGTLLFKGTAPGHTEVRALLTQSWQRLEVTGGGKNVTTHGMVGGVQQNAEPAEYKKLLDLLEKGLG